MSAIFVLIIVAQFGVTSLFLLFPSQAGVGRTFPSFVKCCSRVMFFPFGLQEHVLTHMPHITQYGPSVANAKMEDFLVKARIKALASAPNPLHWYQYVDDTLSRFTSMQ